MCGPHKAQVNPWYKGLVMGGGHGEVLKSENPANFSTKSENPTKFKAKSESDGGKIGLLAI